MCEEEKALEIIEEGESEQAAPPGQEADKFSELNDKYLRLLAEYDNFKKRTQKEKTDIYTNAAADVIAAILPVLDAVSRAVELEKDSEGLKLLKKQLDDALQAIGVEEICAQGQSFDPALHNAVMHIDDDSQGSSAIIEEFAKGYKYKNKVIRHSMVKVAN